MPQKLYPFEAFGAKFQIPVLAVYALSAIVVAGVGYGVFRKVYDDPERVIISQKDVITQLAAEVEEYSLHAMEDPQKHELFEDVEGKLVLRVFKDHCIMIQRQTRSGVRTKLVIDLARANIVKVSRQVVPAVSFMVPLFAAQACNRGCLNPHPGEFTWRYGQQHGAWVEVWRRWNHGPQHGACEHVQMFNPQAGLWDTNPDGSPRVRWICCVH